MVYQAVQGGLTVGELTFLTGAIAGTSGNIQIVFSMFSKIADQALFLGDLVEFFAVRPSIPSRNRTLSWLLVRFERALNSVQFPSNTLTQTAEF